jgi:outer membrane lipoprotein SlyB/translation initiation factor 2 beta subunit (eIF-2beta)/eIF-5
MQLNQETTKALEKDKKIVEYFKPDSQMKDYLSRLQWSIDLIMNNVLGSEREQNKHFLQIHTIDQYQSFNAQIQAFIEYVKEYEKKHKRKITTEVCELSELERISLYIKLIWSISFLKKMVDEGKLPSDKTATLKKEFLEQLFVPMIARYIEFYNACKYEHQDGGLPFKYFSAIATNAIDIAAIILNDRAHIYCFSPDPLNKIYPDPPRDSIVQGVFQTLIGAVIGAVIGMALWGLIGFICGGLPGAIIGLVVGGVICTLIGALLGSTIYFAEFHRTSMEPYQDMQKRLDDSESLAKIQEIRTLFFGARKSIQSSPNATISISPNFIY